MDPGDRPVTRYNMDLFQMINASFIVCTSIDKFADNIIIKESVTQILYPSDIVGNDVGSYYIRKYNGTTFTSWYKVSGIAV